MKLSVIIPTYNRSDVLPKCLDRLVNQSLAASDYEINNWLAAPGRGQEQLARAGSTPGLIGFKARLPDDAE